MKGLITEKMIHVSILIIAQLVVIIWCRVVGGWLLLYKYK